MDVAELIEIALAGVDSGRVEVSRLQPARLAAEVVAGSAELICELVDQALQFVPAGERVSVAGSQGEGGYEISISPSGTGFSPDLIDALNRLLADPGALGRDANLMVGMLFAARLAARHRLGVRWSRDGTVRVRIPASLVVPSGAGTPGVAVREIVFRVASRRPEGEDFLERTFSGERPDREPPSPVAAEGESRIPAPALFSEEPGVGYSSPPRPGVAVDETEEFLRRVFAGE